MLRWLRARFRRRQHPAAIAAPIVPIRPATSITLDDLDEIVPEQRLVVLDPMEIAALETTLLEEVTYRKLALPPFPATAARVFELVEQPEVDLNKLVTALHWEPAIATEILRLANSAKFSRATDDLRSAVLTLGMAEVASIVAGVSAASLFEVESRFEYELFPELWTAAHRETLAEAFTASWLAQAKSVPRHDRVFLRTVLEGVARTLALRALAAMILEGKQALPAPEVIATAIDSIQPAVAEIVLARWSLPASVTSAIEPRAGTERAIVATVRSLVELRRTALRDQTAARFGVHARAINLDTRWLRVLVRELDDATARVSSMLHAQAKAA